MNLKNLNIGSLIKESVSKNDIDINRICNFLNCTEIAFREVYGRLMFSNIYFGVINFNICCTLKMKLLIFDLDRQYIHCEYIFQGQVYCI